FVEREQCEVPGHELDDRPQSNHRRPDSDAGKAELSDRSIDDTHRAELVEESLGDLVGSVVLRDFFPHKEDAIVTLQLLAQRLSKCVAIGEYRHQLVVSV